MPNATRLARSRRSHWLTQPGSRTQLTASRARSGTVRQPPAACSQHLRQSPRLRVLKQGRTAAPSRCAARVDEHRCAAPPRVRCAPVGRSAVRGARRRRFRFRMNSNEAQIATVAARKNLLGALGVPRVCPGFSIISLYAYAGDVARKVTKARTSGGAFSQCLQRQPQARANERHRSSRGPCSLPVHVSLAFADFIHQLDPCPRLRGRPAKLLAPRTKSSVLATGVARIAVAVSLLVA
jgi:hypothetical protein